MGMRSDYLRERDGYRPEHEKKSGISNLQIYKTIVKKIALGATLAVVGTMAGKVALDHYIEYDNMKFEQEGERIHDEVVELTGETPEEIMERGMSR